MCGQHYTSIISSITTEASFERVRTHEFIKFSKHKRFDQRHRSMMGQYHSGGEIVSPGTSPFDVLPEDCISNIISFTSPRDACVAASVSKTFESAVSSDCVWDKFLPPEYESLVSRSRVFASKKELYFALCHNPVLIEDGKKVFI